MGFADTRLRKLSIGLRVSPPVFTLPHSLSPPLSLSLSFSLSRSLTVRSPCLARCLSYSIHKYARINYETLSFASVIMNFTVRPLLNYS